MKGKDMGEYRIKRNRIIGSGAYGIVHPGIRIVDRMDVAVKVISRDEHPDLVAKSQDIYRYLKVKHRNILATLDYTIKEGNFYIFMEYCKYGCLTKYVRLNAPVKSQTRLNIMLQIANGIEFLHNSNIVHRDMKPANVLVQDVTHSVPYIKLADYDLSKYIDPDNGTSRMTSNVGTERFKAPEFWMVDIAGKRNYHRDVDIWATGLVFLALCQELNRNDGKLLPYLETPIDVSEIHNAIGGTMANRMKMMEEMKSLGLRPSLNVVVIGPEETGFSKRLKKLIIGMTQSQPKDRISATQVVNILQKMFLDFDIPEILIANEPITIDYDKKLGKQDSNNIDFSTEEFPPPLPECKLSDQHLCEWCSDGRFYARSVSRISNKCQGAIAMHRGRVHPAAQKIAHSKSVTRPPGDQCSCEWCSQRTFYARSTSRITNKHARHTVPLPLFSNFPSTSTSTCSRDPGGRVPYAWTSVCLSAARAVFVDPSQCQCDSCCMYLFYAKSLSRISNKQPCHQVVMETPSRLLGKS